MSQKQTIHAILFDLDGVLYIGDQTIPGAAETIQAVKAMGYAVAGITNTTTQPREAIARKLADMGIPITAAEIHTPAAVAIQTIGSSTARLFVRDTVLADFASAGAKLLALHKNRFWQRPEGLNLDLGPFVAAIEYAADVRATILGKPSAELFHTVCSSLSCAPEQALMIGDDIESDIDGARKAGLQTALVQTGKYLKAFVDRSGIKADHLLASVADLPSLLNS